MPYVVVETSRGTKNYWTTSSGKDVDYSDVRFARVYPKAATAKRVAKQLQDREMHWFENEQAWLREGRKPYPDWEPGYHGVAPNWTVEEVHAEADFLTLIEEALQGLRRARNNLSRDAFLAEVRRVTEDANVAMPLMEASTQVSMERLRAVGQEE